MLSASLQQKDRIQFLVNDTTVWDAEQVRADYGLHLIAERFVKSKYVPLPAVSSLQPSLSEKWTISTELDGSYRLILVAAKFWDGLLSYPKGSVVSDEDKLFVSIADAPEGTNTIDTEYFKEVKSGSDIDLLRGVSNGMLTILHHLHDLRSQLCLGEKAIAYAGEKCGCSDDCESIKDWSWSMIFHQAAAYSMLFGEYEEAGKFIDNVNARCGSDSGKSPCNCG